MSIIPLDHDLFVVLMVSEFIYPVLKTRFPVRAVLSSCVCKNSILTPYSYFGDIRNY